MSLVNSNRRPCIFKDAYGYRSPQTVLWYEREIDPDGETTDYALVHRTPRDNSTARRVAIGAIEPVPVDMVEIKDGQAFLKKPKKSPTSKQSRAF